MEIIFAILLLVGGFTLGSSATDEHDDITQTSIKIPTTDADGVPSTHQATEALQKKELAQCHSDGKVIYRDLTISYQDQLDLHMSQDGSCEENCSDE